VSIHETGELVGLSVPSSARVSEVQAAIEGRLGVPVAGQRLIWGGRELDEQKSLDELNILPREVLYLLPRHHHVCREWAATGSCSRGRRCYMKATHTVENSPRYVGHKAAKPTAQQGFAPQPPSTARPRPSYGVLTPQDPLSSEGSAPSFQGETGGSRPVMPTPMPANWGGGALALGPRLQRVSKVQQSNSGDWDGLVHDISAAVIRRRGEGCSTEGSSEDDEDEEEEDEDEIQEMDEERSWDEAVATAAIMPLVPQNGVRGVPFSQDSGIAGQLCVAGAPGALRGFDMDLSDLSSSSGSLFSETEPPTSRGISPPNRPATTPAEHGSAGLEFSAGVHLISEMEEQVREWEASEAAREEAYKSWVNAQMMARITSNATPSSPAVCVTNVASRVR